MNALEREIRRPKSRSEEIAEAERDLEAAERVFRDADVEYGECVQTWAATGAVEDYRAMVDARSAYEYAEFDRYAAQEKVENLR